MHDIQYLVCECYKRVRIGADKTDFNSGIYRRRQFEQACTGDRIRIIGFHVSVEILFIFFRVFTIRQLHQYIGKVGFRTY